MNPQNKILTVAYGTFSCTLEGFDDPFSTMTDIAEYFRDLAAEDRFFGAEPPTPDMAMLQQIAQTRTPHSIEAQNAPDGLTLRAGTPAEALAPAAAPAPAPAPEPPTEVDATDSVALKLARIRGIVAADRSDDATYEEDAGGDGWAGYDHTALVADVEDAELSTDEAGAEGEAGVEEPVSEDVAEDIAAAIEDVAGDAASNEGEAADDATSADAADARHEVAADEAEPLEAVEEIDAATDDAPEADVEEEIAAEAEEPKDETASDADVADDEAMADEVAASAQEDEDADAEGAQADPVETAEAADETAAERIEDAPAEEAADDVAADADADVAEPDAPKIDMSGADTLAAILAEDTLEDTGPADVTAEALAASEDGDVMRERRIRRIRIRRAAHAELAASGEAEAEVATSVELSETVEMPAAEDAPAATDLPDAAEAELMAELAAIVDEDGDAPTTEAEADEDADADLEALLAAAEAPEAEIEDDLEAELAAIAAEEEAVAPAISEADDRDDVAAAEAESPAEEPETAEAYEEDEIDLSDDAGDVVADETAAEAEDASVEESDLAEDEDDAAASEGGEPDLERLFAATDSRLSGAETSRTHANISHLKAAVAARRADSSMDTPKADDTGAYRADLASTVRPRRATAEGDARTERPVSRPAPLVLVSSQRVEGEEPAPEAAAAEPVRPRRVTSELSAIESGSEADATEDAAPEAEATEDAPAGTDFEAFAAEMGAGDMTEVLEAAAAYTLQVQGQETFSRPRLLHLASEALEDFTREDGLRGFGQLLREGTIRKLRRGAFVLDEDSRFLTEARRRVG